MQFLEKILRAYPGRKSRFHTLSGEIAGLGVLLRTPMVFGDSLYRRITGLQNGALWIPRNAQAEIQKHIKPDWRVLEFGSGLSTIWWAMRVASVISIEHNRKWYFEIQQKLEARGRKNVDFRFCDLEGYEAAVSDMQPGSVDFIVVDGVKRLECMYEAIRLVKKDGGFVYLDNSDVQTDERLMAREVLLSSAREQGGQVLKFVDYPPGMFQVTEGTLVRF